MAFEIFIDTNIFIDFFIKDRNQHKSATEVFDLIEKGEINAFISESVLNTACYLLRKHYGSAEMKIILKSILSFLTIINCTNEIYLKSLELKINDIEDAVLYQLAVEQKVDYFLTSDKKVFRSLSTPSLPVITAEEFLKLTML